MSQTHSPDGLTLIIIRYSAYRYVDVYLKRVGMPDRTMVLLRHQVLYQNHILDWSPDNHFLALLWEGTASDFHLTVFNADRKEIKTLPIAATPTAMIVPSDTGCPYKPSTSSAVRAL